MSSHRGPYRPSVKRQAGAEDRRQRLKTAAELVFARDGLDGASVAAIVAASGLSTGTFYNYFGTKDAVFDALMADILAQIRAVTGAARARATTLDEMFLTSYEAHLALLVASGWVGLIARNQYHVRARLHEGGKALGLVEDIKTDIARLLPATARLADQDLTFVAHMVISQGLEAVLTLHLSTPAEIARAAGLMARMTVGGLTRLQARDA